MNVCVGVLKGNEKIVFRLAQLSPVDIKLCSVVKGELYYGAKASQQIATILKSSIT